MLFLRERLKPREENGSLRTLTRTPASVDFSSNDYLGFARLLEPVASAGARPGSTGSRLLTGNSDEAEALEVQIARFHSTEAALLFNSGFDANVGLLSALLREGDVIVYDDRIHASMRDGIRLGHAQAFPFRHGDLHHLESRLLRQARGSQTFVAVESLYSMDGDIAPLTELASLCARYGAHLIVDEAHATGVYGDSGQGLVQDAGIESKVFARIHTFGKALGCHGAAVVGSGDLKTYLLNFARPLIYSTALPPSAWTAASAAYSRLSEASESRKALHSNITLFRSEAERAGLRSLQPSSSPIQAYVVPGNEKARATAHQLQAQGFDVRAILSPTVPSGEERLRVCIHSFNTENEIRSLILALQEESSP